MNSMFEEPSAGGGRIFKLAGGTFSTLGMFLDCRPVPGDTVSQECHEGHFFKFGTNVHLDSR